MKSLNLNKEHLNAALMNDVEKIPYRAFIPGDKPRPLIEVEIEKVGIVLCVIDSGADYSTFPKRIGQETGIDFSLAKKSTSECAHGDTVLSYLAPMKVFIRNEEFNLTVNFIENGGEPALLGRYDFFERFEITFDEANQQVLFKKKKVRV